MMQPTIKKRLISLALYLLILYTSMGLITGNWIPVDGGKSLWFYSGIALYFFTNLTAPFFATPKDSLANAATSALLLATIDFSSVQALQNELNFFRWMSFTIALATLVFAISAIVLYEREFKDNPKLTAYSKASYRLSDILGRGQIMFSPPVIISIIGFYQDAIIQQTWLFFIWLIVIFMQPVDLLIYLYSLFLNQEKIKAKSIGVIQRIDSPHIVRVKLSLADTWKRDNVHIAHLPDSRQVEVLPLFIQLQNQELIGTGFYCYDIPEKLLETSSGSMYFPASSRTAKEIIKDLSGDDSTAHLIGFVIEKSGISKICFEITSELKLEKGWLIFTFHGGNKVYYQIIDAETKEESFSENPRGTQVVFAEQLGILDDVYGFKKHGWLPTMNAPVFLSDNKIEIKVPENKNEFIIGSVPNSKINVRVRFDYILENHTAILGATGAGKTELAFDVIKVALKNDAKVICVDFTGEYKPRLQSLSPASLGISNERIKELEELALKVETGEYGAGKERAALETFIKNLMPEIYKEVETFLESEDKSVGIFEIEEIANTKATLRVTELYLSTIFNWARKNRKKQKILLVLEEAHTIVPESNVFGFDKVETSAVIGRMAQIALQGRKYGVGILLISQRTALVSKTLLSQCQTVFCFKIHDDTGLRYLENVFSHDNVKIIPNLKFLQGIAFGKAILSEQPIIFEIPFDDAKKVADSALDTQPKEKKTQS